MSRNAAIALVLLAGCGGRARAPLPPVTMPLAATPESGFDAPPAVAPLARTLPAAPTEIVLSNGLRVVIEPRRDLPIVAITLASRASGDEDAGAMPGIHVLLERVMYDEAGRIAPSIADFGRPTTEVLSNGVLVACDVESASTAEAMRAIAQLVRMPRLDPAVVTRTRRALDRDIGTSVDSLSEVLELHLDQMLYGEDDPRSRTWYGDREEFRGLTRDALLARHHVLFAPAASALFVVGDVDVAAIEALATELFAPWQRRAQSATWLPAPTFDPPSARLHGFPTTSDQSVIRLRERAPHGTHADRPGFEVLSALLGGMFGARINMLIREERGHTYGVRAATLYFRDHGYFEIELAVPASATRSTIHALIDELRRLSDPERIDPGELERARAHTLGALRSAFASRHATARSLAVYFLRGDSREQLAARMEAIASLDRAEVARVARRWLRAEHAPIVVHGDAQYLVFSMGGIPGGYELVRDP